MDLNYTPEETAFREDIRTFLAQALRPELAEKVALAKALPRLSTRNGTHA